MGLVPAGDTPCFTVCRRETFEKLLLGLVASISVALWCFLHLSLVLVWGAFRLLLSSEALLSK